MTLYDTPAQLLDQIASAAAIGAEHVDQSDMARDLRQAERISRRIAAMWPQLFSSLFGEIKILEATLTETLERIDAAGIDRPAGLSRSEDADPLARYQVLVGDLDCVFNLLAQHSPDQWAQDARRVLRRGLGAAAEVQGRIVDAAFDA